MPKNGFTLIELLVTIAIIGVLASIAGISYQSVLKNGRDAKRHSDLKQIQSALEQYHSDNFFYPKSTAACKNGDFKFGCSLTDSSENRIYLNKVPQDPIGNPEYSYIPSPANCDNGGGGKCTVYCLYARLENAAGKIPQCSDMDPPYNLEITAP